MAEPKKREPMLRKSLLPTLAIIFLLLLLTSTEWLYFTENAMSYFTDLSREGISRAEMKFDEHALQLYMFNQRRSLLNVDSILFVNFRKGVIPELLYDAFRDDINVARNRSDYDKIFSNPSGGDIVLGLGSLCHTIQSFKETNGIKQHLIFSSINENWGAFSSQIPNRTSSWGEWSKTWENDGCDMNDLDFYLNHENVTAVFTTTHQNAIKPHSKVHTLALGPSKNPQIMAEQIHGFAMSNRTKTLMINMAKTDTRTLIADRVISNFNGTIENTYGRNTNAYFEEIRESKFVLCPSGMGWDTYRSWEAMMLGAIPILETFYREDGFFRVYDNLPVLWVDHYDNVTPALLEKEYPKILSKAHEYKFEKLTKQWWIDLINGYRPNKQPARAKAKQKNVEQVVPNFEVKTYASNISHIPTIDICDVTTLKFDPEQKMPTSISRAYIPTNGTNLAYGPFITKVSSTSITKALKAASDDAPTIDLLSTPDEILRQHQFFTVLRHPMERMLSVFHQIEVFWIMNWITTTIDRDGLTWWNKTCLNATWGADSKRDRPCMGSKPITTTESRLQHLNDFLDDLTNIGFFDQHIAPMSYIISTNKIHQDAKYFDFDKVPDLINAIFESSGKKKQMFTTMQRGEPSADGMDWVVRWKELVDLAPSNELAASAIEKMCLLYRNDVECFPYDVPECNGVYWDLK